MNLFQDLHCEKFNNNIRVYCCVSVFGNFPDLKNNKVLHLNFPGIGYRKKTAPIGTIKRPNHIFTSYIN